MRYRSGGREEPPTGTDPLAPVRERVRAARWAGMRSARDYHLLSLELARIATAAATSAEARTEITRVAWEDPDTVVRDAAIAALLSWDEPEGREARRVRPSPRPDGPSYGPQPFSGRDAHVSAYRRPDAYYLVAEAHGPRGQTRYSTEPATVIPLGASAERLGSALTILLEGPRPDERARLDVDPVFLLAKQAGVRGWLAFVRGAALVHVDREGPVHRVMPLRQDSRQLKVFAHQNDRIVDLEDPASGSLGAAVLEAFTRT